MELYNQPKGPRLAALVCGRRLSISACLTRSTALTTATDGADSGSVNPADGLLTKRDDCTMESVTEDGFAVLFRMVAVWRAIQNEIANSYIIEIAI